jgi:hypothetical protein
VAHPGGPCRGGDAGVRDGPERVEKEHRAMTAPVYVLGALLLLMGFVFWCVFEDDK